MCVCVCVFVCVCECVCVCVCVCVCPAPAARPTQAITPKFGMGSSFHPGSAPSQGATSNVDPWGTPYSDPVWKTLKGKELDEQKLLHGVGLYSIILFIGGSPKPGARRVHPTNGGVCFENWAGASKQKLLTGVGLCIKILFVGGSPQTQNPLGP